MINVFVEYVSSNGDSYIQKHSFKNHDELNKWEKGLVNDINSTYWSRSFINVYIVGEMEAKRYDIPIGRGDQRPELENHKGTTILF